LSVLKLRSKTEKKTASPVELEHPDCPACRDFGYLPRVGWEPPERASMRELLENCMPCACLLGDKFRATGEEWKKPILAADGRIIHAGTLPLWEAA
jgi:hypothetical protein